MSARAPSSIAGRVLRWGGFACLALLALAAALLWTISSMAIAPPWYVHSPGAHEFAARSADAPAFFRDPHSDPQNAHGYAFEDVEFDAADGSSLRGWWVPAASAARVGIVAVHGGGSDRREFLRHLPLFREAGYPVLLFDCREHGRSDGDSRGVTFGVREHIDVRSAAAFARVHGKLDTVVALGTSQGAASAILAAAGDPAIDAVIAENPFTDVAALVRDGAAAFNAHSNGDQSLIRLVARLVAWRIGADEIASPLEAVARIAPRPLFLLHGTADRVIPVAHSRALGAQAPEAELWILEGAGHAALFDHAPAQWTTRVLDFLRRRVGPAVAVAEAG